MSLLNSPAYYKFINHELRRCGKVKNKEKMVWRYIRRLEVNLLRKFVEDK